MLSVTLLPQPSPALWCPLNVWAGPLLVVLFITNPRSSGQPSGLSGLGSCLLPQEKSP